MARRIGTDKKDRLQGTDRDDLLKGKSGNDRLDPLGGDDSASGGAGKDRMIWRTGSDTFDGGPGKDTLDLSKFGDFTSLDSLRAQSALDDRDFWNTLSIADTLVYNSRRFELGQDDVDSQLGVFVDLTDEGIRVLSYQEIRGVLEPGLDGETDTAVWNGLDAMVELSELHGARAAAVEILIGTEGEDHFRLDDNLRNFSQDYEARHGVGRIDAGGGGDIVHVNFQGMNQPAGGSFQFAGLVKAGAGDDYVRADGADGTLLDGGKGQDMLIAFNTGSDFKIRGGEGDDRPTDMARFHQLLHEPRVFDPGDSGLPAQFGGGLHGSRGDDTIEGGGGKDLLVGGPGKDRLSGGGGDDEIWADELGGSVQGIPGDDILKGGKGNDRLVAGYGLETMIGGAGRDEFIIMTEPQRQFSNQFAEPNAVVTVGDFDPGRDSIGFARSLGTSYLDRDSLLFERSGGDVHISWDGVVESLGATFDGPDVLHFVVEDTRLKDIAADDILFL